MSQAEFRAALLDPARLAPPGLTAPDGRPAGRRFDVYRNNVTVSLTEALRQAFPALRKLVGEDFFAAMAREHLRAHPPASPVLMFYGGAMPAFLETFPPVAHLPYLAAEARRGDHVEDDAVGVHQHHRQLRISELLVEGGHLELGAVDDVGGAPAALRQAVLVEHLRARRPARVELVVFQAANPGTGHQLAGLAPRTPIHDLVDPVGMAAGLACCTCAHFVSPRLPTRTPRWSAPRTSRIRSRKSLSTATGFQVKCLVIF